jgi:hypothetical protein
MPQQILEDIYLRLDPLSRARFRCSYSLPKHQLSHFNFNKERKLAVVNNYISKNKIRLVESKTLPSAIKGYLVENIGKDAFVTHLANEVGIDRLSQSVYEKLMNEKTIELDAVYDVDLVTITKGDVEGLVARCTTQKFDSLCNNESTYKVVSIVLGDIAACQSLIFRLVSYELTPLLEKIICRDFPKSETFKDSIDASVVYMQGLNIASIFVWSVQKIKVILKLFNLKKETIKVLLEKAEENIYTDSAFELMKSL